ncbi:hypothetical protein SCHPADRAFT_988086, partial [Schizopora paradoxa]
MALTNFGFKTRGVKFPGERVSTCIECTSDKQANRREGKKAKAANKENERAEDDGNDSDESSASNQSEADAYSEADFNDLPLISVEDFFAILSSKKEEPKLRLAAKVDVGKLKEIPSLKDKAASLAELVWEEMQYRFVYHSQYTSTSRFRFYCAQNKERKRKSKKLENEEKHRDRDRMEYFGCHGWLNIRFCEGNDVAQIKIVHTEAHVHYCKIDVPEDVKKFLWNKILTNYPTPKFTRKSISELWATFDRKKWKRADDELESAKLLLEELAQKAADGQLSKIESLFLAQEPGHVALSFAFPGHLERWADRIREISMDSAWNTNGSSYELFALLGETYGKGLPLAYLLVKSDGTGPAGAKERLLTQFLKHVKCNWHLRVSVTLTDKDASEIAACRCVFPEATHRLCFWHALRAFKTRLSILRRAPAFYDVDNAVAEFPWIDAAFTDDESAVATVAMPQIKFRFNGKILSMSNPERTRLTITYKPLRDRSNALGSDGPSENTIHVVPRDLHVTDIPDELALADAQDGGVDQSGGADEGLDDAEVSKWLEKGGEEMDEEDAPDWMFDAGEVKAKDPNYVFCPAPHRRQALRLFTKHYCQHQALIERDSEG